jgi:hypothetical protein
MKKYINSYVLMMIGMLLIIAIGVVQNMHENQMAEENAIQQQKIVVEQGQKAKQNTQWKLDHHNGTIPAYKD